MHLWAGEVHDRDYEWIIEMWDCSRASNEGYPKVREDFTIPEKAPTRVHSHLRHY